MKKKISPYKKLPYKNLFFLIKTCLIKKISPYKNVTLYKGQGVREIWRIHRKFQKKIPIAGLVKNFTRWGWWDLGELRRTGILGLKLGPQIWFKFLHQVQNFA